MFNAAEPATSRTGLAHAIASKRAVTRIAMAAVAAALGTGIAGCAVHVEHPGPEVVRTRPIAAFDRIEVRGSLPVTVRRGAGGTITLQGGRNRVADVTTRVRSGALIVAQHDRSGTIDVGDKPVTVTVSTPSLTSARVSGSGQLTMYQVSGKRLVLDIDGSGGILAHGHVDTLHAALHGSGDLALAGVSASSATVTESGSGTAEVHAVDRLNAAVNGSGQVHYEGHPRLVRTVNGSGGVSALQP